MSKLIPTQAIHRKFDLTSDAPSPESKANTARWFAEMIIKDFLSDKFPTGDNFQNSSIGELILKLKGKIHPTVIDALNQIKKIGDQASHYNSNQKILDIDAKKSIDTAFSLFPLLIIDHLKKNPLSEHPDRALLLSTTLPSIRLQILDEIMEFDSDKVTQYQLEILHKWCLACAKSGKRDKARRKLKDLLKRNKISIETHSFEENSINEITRRMANNELPIAKTHADFVRNFGNVMNRLSQHSKEENAELIKLLNGMVEGIEPSEMGHLKGMQIFPV
ncbi:hypothetical protein [Janthinobacterium sp. NKUCC06_STL]|uniref:hypothetical protein n=1 Tax=Janthinobacterium sp. NKUCC06_STL TaxID=2842127 RepID=UPI001C5B820C|nr:hypothetical protein [Janthinobacterium sp. NKUCC06_STL]MBW3512250.1 hypothetical protein [Janthinobacterium sp. NKUCC06_STL]